MGSKTRGSGKALGVTQEERAQIFVLLAKVHTELDQVNEAAKVIQDAKGEFYDTPAHAQVLIVDSELALR
jgi:hypothetical protein